MDRKLVRFQNKGDQIFETQFSVDSTHTHTHICSILVMVKREPSTEF